VGKVALTGNYVLEILQVFNFMKFYEPKKSNIRAATHLFMHGINVCGKLSSLLVSCRDETGPKY